MCDLCKYLASTILIPLGLDLLNSSGASLAEKFLREASQTLKVD